MIKIFCIFTTILLLCGCSTKFNRFDDSELKSFLVEDEQYFDFSFVNMFEWDKVYIIPPYTSRQTISDKIGIQFNLPTTIQSSDTVNLLIFINKNKVVKYDEVPRRIVDFDISDTTLITLENSKVKIRY
ncbi:hypothetical protein GMB70_12050 [Turicibacter sanguinis]|nr:hypothetical protein [Turicibacter sanguinis]